MCLERLGFIIAGNQKLVTFYRKTLVRTFNFAVVHTCLNRWQYGLQGKLVWMLLLFFSDEKYIFYFFSETVDFIQK